jgi:transposase
VTATSFVATLDEASRFADAKQVRAYLGLVPSEYRSGERQQRGHINKTGPGRTRYLLVESAWTILRRGSPTNLPLHAWGKRIAERRGQRVAVVALARKLAGILFVMWRDGTSFDPRASPSDKREIVPA